MASELQQRRAQRGPRNVKRAIGADEVQWEDVDLILELAFATTPGENTAAEQPRRKPRRSWRTLKAVCLTGSRIVGPTGETVFEQHASPTEAQQLRLANEAAGEKQWFLVHYKDACEAPSWELAVDVGKPLIAQFKHLLHVLPLAAPRALPDQTLAVLKDEAVYNLGVSFSMALRQNLGQRNRKHIYEPQLTVTQNIDAGVFLALFGSTAAYSGETYTSLLAHHDTSRNVTFAEIDAVLAPAFASWHSRTNVTGLHIRVDRSQPLRLSILHLNSFDFDHAGCQVCSYPKDRPLLGKPRNHTPTKEYLFTAWQMRLTAKFIRSV